MIWFEAGSALRLNPSPLPLDVLCQRILEMFFSSIKKQWGILIELVNYWQARKPYDVRDVIEQYSQGHLNMMVRIKVNNFFFPAHALVEVNEC
jgi:hypothetical protein